MLDSACIEIENLWKSYNWGKVHALNDVSLRIGTGEIFGLIGPNGAGKTTLLGCLLAIIRPTDGVIRINGKPADDLSVRRITGFLPERPYFDAWMTVNQFLRYHHMLSGQPDSAAKTDIEAALNTVDLDGAVGERLVRKLSRGMLQRLGLAQVLVGKPRLCFLDEPTSGMDPLGMALVRSLLMEWKKQNVTVVLNSHHLDQVESVCDRVALIRAGKIESVVELNGSLNQQHRLIVRWRSSIAAGEELADCAGRLAIEIDSIEGNQARFLLDERSVAADLVKALVLAGVEVEEVSFERKSLSGLFLKDESAGS